MTDVITLYRLVSSRELALIVASQWKAFPPHLPGQPIFHPVTTEASARQIARDWNARYNDDRCGFVTKFSVRAEVANRYERGVVGGREHEELRVPAEDLPAFNAAIVGAIEMVAEYYGE